MMKSKIAALVILVVVVMFAAMFLNPEFNRMLNRWGKTQYYAMIAEDGVREPYSGKQTIIFKHQSPAFSTDGNERILTFTADKLLRRHAYLRLYAKDDGTVTAWEEVTGDEIPARTREKFR